MKIISVAGTGSETGKTTVGALIINTLGNVCALKITVRHDGICPKDKDSSCDGCSSMRDSLFRIFTDPAILSAPGKDTARYIEAGAPKVVWLQTNSECAKEGIRRALRLFDENDTVLIEGNRFLAIGDADIAIMVISPHLDKIKRSAMEIFEKIDLFVINRRPGHREELIESTKSRLISMGCNAPIIVLDPYNSESAAQDILIERIRETLNPPVGMAPKGPFAFHK